MDSIENGIKKLGNIIETSFSSLESLIKTLFLANSHANNENEKKEIHKTPKTSKYVSKFANVVGKDNKPISLDINEKLSSVELEYMKLYPIRISIKKSQKKK